MRAARAGWIALGLALAILVTWAWAQQGNEQTHYPVPNANSTFLSDLRTFLYDEDAARYTDIFGAGVVASGGTHGPTGGLIGTPAPLAAYPGGFYVTETGAITYPNNASCWVIATRDLIGNPGTFSRVVGTRYALDCVSTVQPPWPTNSVPLMQVTTSGGGITAVRDIRPFSAAKDPLVPPGTLQIGVPLARTGVITFYNAGSAFGTSLQAGVAGGAITYSLPVTPPTVSGALLSTQTDGRLSWVSPAGVALPPAPVRFFYHGNCSVGTKVVQELIELNGTIVKVWAYADVAPTGADLVLDIKRNGTSIWNATPANRLKILSGANAGTQTTFDSSGGSAGDRYSMDVVQIGSTTPGCNDLLVSIQFG